MRAIILAAGRGSRLGAFTKNRPKCLTLLLGRPLLDYQLSALNSAGVHNVAIVTGYCREQLEGRAQHEFHNPVWESTSILTSLFSADEWLQSSDCIISYSDLFYPTAFIRSMIAAPSGLSIAYDPDALDLWKERFVDPLSDAESFVVNSEGRLLEIGEKFPPLYKVHGQYLGLFRTSPAEWRRCRRFADHLESPFRLRLDMTAFFSLLLKQGALINAVPVKGVWGEIDSQSDLELYQNRYGSLISDLD